MSSSFETVWFLDPGSLSHGSQIRALSGMGSLIPGFTIVPVIDTEDAQVGGFHHSNRCQGSNIHQQFSSPVHTRTSFLRLGKANPRPIETAPMAPAIA